METRVNITWLNQSIACQHRLWFVKRPYFSSFILTWIAYSKCRTKSKYHFISNGIVSEIRYLCSIEIKWATVLKVEYQEFVLISNPWHCFQFKIRWTYVLSIQFVRKQNNAGECSWYRLLFEQLAHRYLSYCSCKFKQFVCPLYFHFLNVFFSNENIMFVFPYVYSTVILLLPFSCWIHKKLHDAKINHLYSTHSHKRTIGISFKTIICPT